MSADTQSDGLTQLLELFNLPTKAAAEKKCRAMVFTSDDLFRLLIGARTGILAPYRYACHFDEVMAPELELTDEDRGALTNNGVGKLQPRAQKTMRKINQIFEARRLFAAHLFYVPDAPHWHMIYFDQRDTASRDNHWKAGGAHMHYVRETHCREPLEQVWANVLDSPPRPPKGEHIRYIDKNRDRV